MRARSHTFSGKMGPLKVGEASLTKLRPTTILQNPEETYWGHVKKVEMKTIFSRQPQSQESRPEQNQELPSHKHTKAKAIIVNPEAQKNS